LPRDPPSAYSVASGGVAANKESIGRMLQRLAVNTLLGVLRFYAFGLWTGAMVGFAFFFAPAAFAHVGPTPAFAATIAASIVAITYFGYVCGGVAVLSALLELRSNRSAVWLAVIAVIMCALGAYETNVVVPLMQHTPLQTPAYDALHHRSSSVYSIVLLLGILAIALSALLQRRAPSAAR
jgi:hypothetical protein